MRIISLIALLLCLNAPSALAQKRVSARAERQYKEAVACLNDNKLDDAAQILHKVFRKNPHYARAGVSQ
jgi:outer membrane protein assembly factor BamD (BamD/ComL family)